MIILGVVGAPAGGKSTVARRLQELGAGWIDADKIAHSVLELDDVQEQIIGHFGREITDAEGRIDRSKLASRVFGDDDAKRAALTYLEGVIHPRTRLIITAKLRELEQNGTVVAILDVPLLFEGGWDRTCDEIWCVDSPRELRLERAKDRGWTAEELSRREANQQDIENKKRQSSVVIDNSGSLEQLYETIDQRWGLLIQRQRDGQPDSQRHCTEDD